MANIKSDNQGFLIGEPLDLNKTFELWSDIRNDMRAIRMALNGEDISKSPTSGPISSKRVGDSKRIPQQPVATPQRRDESIIIDGSKASSAPLTIDSATHKALLEPLKPAATPDNVSRRLSSAPLIAASTHNNTIVNPLTLKPAATPRDVQTGRFTKSVEDNTAQGNKRIGNDRYVEIASTSNDSSSMRMAAEKIASAVSSASNGVEETDPAIKAFGEVAQPMARGYEILASGTGREQRDKLRWFRRIFGELRLFRKEETVFNKAANKSLKNIEENPSGGDASGDDSSWLRRYILPMLVLALAPVMAGIFGTGSAIGKAWNEAVADFKSVATKIINSWNSTTDKFNNVLSNIGSKIESFWNTFTGFIKDKFGIDIQGAVDAAKEKVSNATSKATEAVKESRIGKVMSKVWDSTKDATQHVYDNAEAAAGSALEDIMPKGYRHKATFDGIKGGDKLSRNGTYTDAEAHRIRALKTSAANTSANLPGGMPREIQDKISAQAKKHGLDPVMMQKIAAIESGGNPNAISENGAIGIYQFTGQTASGVGINNRFDVDQNIEGGMKLTVQNMSALKKSGLPVTAENIYMMHQLGPSAAQEIIRGSMSGKSKADLSTETQRSMNHNYGKNSTTASEYIDINRDALDKRYSVTVTSSAPQESVKSIQDQIIVPIKVGQAQTAYAQVPESPRMPAPQLPADEPTIMEPLASTGSRSQNIVTSAQPEVGQDVKDRRIAHIVTGGLSN